MSGLGAFMVMVAGMSMAFGDGLSYLDNAGTCAMCKAKGLNKNEDGESICEACPYYETSLLMPDPEGGDQDVRRNKAEPGRDDSGTEGTDS